MHARRTLTADSPRSLAQLPLDQSSVEHRAGQRGNGILRKLCDDSSAGQPPSLTMARHRGRSFQCSVGRALWTDLYQLTARGNGTQDSSPTKIDPRWEHPKQASCPQDLDRLNSGDRSRADSTAGTLSSEPWKPSQRGPLYETAPQMRGHVRIFDT